MTGPKLAEYRTRRTGGLVSSTGPDGPAHAAPTLFTSYATFSFTQHAWQDVSGSSSTR